MKSFSLAPVRLAATCAMAVSSILGAAACSKAPSENVVFMGIEFERDGSALTYRESGEPGWVDLSCNRDGTLNIKVVRGYDWTTEATGNITHTSCADRVLEPGEIRQNEIPFTLRG